METQSAINDFDLALKDISKIRFPRRVYIGNDKFKNVSVPPRVVEICRGPCDAGEDCCHKMIKRNIKFCVY